MPVVPTLRARAPRICPHLCGVSDGAKERRDGLRSCNKGEEEMDTHEESPPAPRLLDQVRERIRVLHYSIRTEEQYVQWIRRTILFHNKRHPTELGEAHLEAFLFKLAVDMKVAASTQIKPRARFCFCTGRSCARRSDGWGTCPLPNLQSACLSFSPAEKRSNCSTRSAYYRPRIGWSRVFSTARDCACSKPCGRSSKKSGREIRID